MPNERIRIHEEKMHRKLCECGYEVNAEIRVVEGSEGVEKAITKASKEVF